MWLAVQSRQEQLHCQVNRRLHPHQVEQVEEKGALSRDAQAEAGKRIGEVVHAHTNIDG